MACSSAQAFQELDDRLFVYETESFVDHQQMLESLNRSVFCFDSEVDGVNPSRRFLSEVSPDLKLEVRSSAAT